VVHRGIAFVPQGRRVFTNLTVEENLEIGGFIVKNKRELKRRIAEVMETFPVLKQKRKAKSGTLSGGQQQMLALARGLMTDSKVLLLDEPSLGLAPKIVKEVFAKIKEINEKHKTAIMVVEHNIKSLLGIANRAYVLDKGIVAAEGPSKDIIKSGVLEKVFLAKV
jgi:branched-chain amino acid transport system ATP-binding protein